MQKYFIVIIAIPLIAVLCFPEAQNALVTFFAAGIIPGTTLTIPPLIMIILAAIGLMAAIFLGQNEAKKISLPPIKPAEAKPKPAPKPKKARRKKPN